MKKIAVVLLLIILYSCEKEQLYKPQTQKKEVTTSNSINTNKGILVFKNREQFDSTYNVLKNKPYSYLINWAKSLNFESRLVILEKSNFEDSLYVSDLLMKYKNEKILKLLNTGEIPRFSSYTRNKIKQGVFKLKKIDKIPYLMLQNLIMSPFIDENGLISIGDTLFKYQKNKLYYAEDKKLTKINLFRNKSYLKTEAKSLPIEIEDFSGPIVAVYIDKAHSSEAQNYRHLYWHEQVSRTDYGNGHFVTRGKFYFACLKKTWVFFWSWNMDLAPMYFTLAGNTTWSRMVRGVKVQKTIDYYYHNYVSSYTYTYPFPNNGEVFDGHPYDPTICNWHIHAEGVGLVFDVYRNRPSGIGLY